MDAIADPLVSEVVVIKSAQVGWTEILNNAAGYYIHQDPAPMLVVQPTVDMGEAWSKDRLAPMLRDSPSLRGLISETKSRSSGNTLLHKALALDTPVPTPGGWSTMGELGRDDVVFDERGKPCSVVDLSPVYLGRPCYRVSFSDGSSVVADQDHRWYVEYWRLVNRKQTTIKEVLTTGQMLERGVRNGKRYRFAIPVAKALQAPAVALPVDPYVLGVWLGDGSSHQTDIAASSADADEMAKHLASCGHSVEVFHYADKASRIWVDRQTEQSATGTGGRFVRSETGLRASLRSLGLLSRGGDGNSRKHIPSVYLRASAEQRLALLQGLMDTDGSVTSRADRFLFSSSNQRLAHDVEDLLSGLGIKFARTDFDAYAIVDGQRRPGKPSVRFVFSVPSDFPVFRLSRKRVRQEGRSLTTNATRRRIVGIEPVPSVPVKCISVDSPSHLYLAGRRMVPTHNTFPGGHLTIAGANSAASLASRPIRIVLFDEVDRYPPSAGTEGDPVTLGKKRSTTFWNRKTLLGSTPTISGSSRIEAAYEGSDQRRFWVPCPDCGEFQVLKWAAVRWDGGDPNTALMHCIGCGTGWTDAERYAAVRQGEWRAEAPFRGVAGFHISELYSPWVKLSETVGGFLAAKGKPEMLKAWVNTALGETWQEQGEAPEWERLIERREDYPMGIMPSGGEVMTAGVDVQRDRLECDVWSWGPGLESWLVDSRSFPGAPAEQGVWDNLAEWLGQEWPAEVGSPVRVAGIGVDTGGSDTQAVYAALRRWHDPRVLPMKGLEGWNRTTPVNGPTAVDVNFGGKKLRRGLKLWTVAVSTLKAEFYRLLWLTRGDGVGYPPGWVHLPAGLDAEAVKQMVSEQLVTVKDKRGFARQEWRKLRERNERLDCRNYARAALSVLGADRKGDRFWSQWKRPDLVIEPEEADTPVVPVPTVPAPPKRVFRSNFVGRVRR